MDSSVFIDWLTIYQVHPEGGLPLVNDGRVWAVDSDGSVEWTTDQHLQHEGSFSTKLRLRCDGFKVELSGNVGRFNRSDNLFGYGFAECIARANELLNLYSLPPFTSGVPSFVYQTDSRASSVEWTGAVLTRIDVTQNLCLWNESNARLFLRYLSGKQRGRLKVGVSPDGSSVMWGYGPKGMGSKFVSLIAYNKSEEMQRHLKKGGVSQEVLDYVRSCGVIRIEAKFKTRFLTRRACRFLGEVTMAKLEKLFRIERDKVLVQELQADSYNDIPAPYRATAKDWRDGVDLQLSMKRATYYRHRRQLLKFGIDISVPSSVKTLPPKVVELNPTALVAPDWYRKKYG